MLYESILPASSPETQTALKFLRSKHEKLALIKQFRVYAAQVLSIALSFDGSCRLAVSFVKQSIIINYKMKICVCFKIIPDYDQVTSETWKRPSSLDFGYVKKGYGFFDEGALETALRLKDEYIKTGKQDEIYLEALTYGKCSQLFSSQLYSAGFDRVTILKGNVNEFNSKGTAEKLSSYINDLNFDMILTGEMVGPNDTGSVPYYMANLLKLPVLNCVSGIHLEGDKIKVVRELQDKTEKYDDPGRFIGIVSDAEHPYLRMYPFSVKQEGKNKKAVKKDAGLPARGEKTKLKTPEKAERKIKFIDGTAVEKADAILSALMEAEK